MSWKVLKLVFSSKLETLLCGKVSLKNSTKALMPPENLTFPTFQFSQFSQNLAWSQQIKNTFERWGKIPINHLYPGALHTHTSSQLDFSNIVCIFNCSESTYLCIIFALVLNYLISYMQEENLKHSEKRDINKLET